MSDNMSTLFDGDVYVGLSGLELAEDSFDIGEGICLRKTYAHLMAPFMMAFKPAPPGGHHPAPWKAASGGFSFDVNAELLGFVLKLLFRQSEILCKVLSC